MSSCAFYGDPPPSDSWLSPWKCLFHCLSRLLFWFSRRTKLFPVFLKLTKFSSKKPIARLKKKERLVTFPRCKIRTWELEFWFQNTTNNFSLASWAGPMKSTWILERIHGNQPWKPDSFSVYSNKFAHPIVQSVQTLKSGKNLKNDQVIKKEQSWPENLTNDNQQVCSVRCKVCSRVLCLWLT